METSMEVPRKVKNRTTARPAGPLLGVCPEDVKSPSRSDVRTPGSLPHCSRRSRRGSKPSVHAGCSQRADVAHVTGYVHGRIRCPPGPTMAPGGVTLSRVRQRRGPYDLTRWWNRTKPHVETECWGLPALQGSGSKGTHAQRQDERTGGCDVQHGARSTQDCTARVQGAERGCGKFSPTMGDCEVLAVAITSQHMHISSRHVVPLKLKRGEMSMTSQ